jgi:transposase
MPSQRRSYSHEFKDRAVQYVLQQGKSIGTASKELGIDPKCLRRWVSATPRARAGNTEAVAKETEELHRLRAENKELHMRVELLKKAAAFFANEMRP